MSEIEGVFDYDYGTPPTKEEQAALVKFIAALDGMQHLSGEDFREQIRPHLQELRATPRAFAFVYSVISNEPGTEEKLERDLLQAGVTLVVTDHEGKDGRGPE